MEYKDLLNAVDYVEKHLTEKIDYEEAAKRAYMSRFHFQKVFSLMFGITLGEYIRRRKLSLAGIELINGGVKVIDVALKYGYETPESFSRAFNKYHGVLPSKIAGTKLKFYHRATLDIDFYGENKMDCNISERPELVLVGFKKHFSGAPYGQDRLRQEDDFFCSTRAKQWLLIGASTSPDVDYSIVANADDDGYDYYIAYELDKWTRENLFDSKITGVDLSPWGLEIVTVPRQTCLVFSTDKQDHPIKTYTELRKQIVEKCSSEGYAFANAPEVVAFHWRTGKKEEWRKERHIKVYMPIEVR